MFSPEEGKTSFVRADNAGSLVGTREDKSSVGQKGNSFVTGGEKWHFPLSGNNMLQKKVVLLPCIQYKTPYIFFVGTFLGRKTFLRRGN